MLTELHVENLGIIDDATVVLGPGMTTITGETGAGKTLLVTALELALGGRADPDVVRAGATEAQVEARVVDRHGDEYVLVRVIPTTGRSRAYVNGGLVTASELATIGRGVVDLYGQQAHRALLSPDEQRGALDRFAGDDARGTRDEVAAALADVRGLEAELADLGGDEHARARELELLRYQVDDIRAAELREPDEVETLRSEHELLSDAAAYRRALEEAHELVEGPAVDAVGQAVAGLADRPGVGDLADRLRGTQAELGDLAAELRVRAETISEDPAHLEAVDRRRQVLTDLTHKYGPTLADVLACEREASARLDLLSRADERAGELAQRRGAAQARAARAAARLSELRRAAAGPLAEAATERIHGLAMLNARFDVHVESGPLTADGADTVEFRLQANPGEPSRSLLRSASGGELARVMLALRVALSARDGEQTARTLVFDEVDTGIGGAAGAAVGAALALLGRHHQVLCVTHLAQVAANADAQFAVAKRSRAGRTVAEVGLLVDDSRVAELSRMLAGRESSEHARGHAQELLAAAAAERGR